MQGLSCVVINECKSRDCNVVGLCKRQLVIDHLVARWTVEELD